MVPHNEKLFYRSIEVFTIKCALLQNNQITKSFESLIFEVFYLH